MREIRFTKPEHLSEVKKDAKELFGVLKEINNPYIVLYEDYFSTSNLSFALVTEYFEVFNYLTTTS